MNTITSSEKYVQNMHILLLKHSDLNSLQVSILLVINNN